MDHGSTITRAVPATGRPGSAPPERGWVAGWSRWWDGRFGRVLLAELLVLTTLYEGYKLARRVTAGDYELAFRHAEQVVAVERLLQMASEDDVQRLALSWRPLVWVLNRYYVYGHFVPSILLIIWLYAARGAIYPRVRNAVVVTTAAALVLHVGYPLAPPRMLPGFVDTVARFGPSIYEHASVARVANQIAAMPSLHFGWAVLAAWAVIISLRHPLRWLAVLHPAAMLVTIVATANHWWLDAAVAGLLVVMAVRLDAVLPSVGARHGAQAWQGVTAPAGGGRLSPRRPPVRPRPGSAGGRRPPALAGARPTTSP